MKRLQFALLSLFAMYLFTSTAYGQDGKTIPYKPEFNTIAHELLNLEARANTIDEKKYRLLDELLDSTMKQIPDALRSSASSDRGAALQVLRIVDNVLANHNVVYHGWIDTLGDSLEPHHPSEEEMLEIEFQNPGPNRTAAIRANRMGSFYYFDCKTSSIIYLAVAEVVNMPVFLVDLPGHFFVRWSSQGKSLNWDTNLGIVMSDAEYQATAHIPEDLVIRKFYLENLGKDQVIGSWHGLIGDRLAAQGMCREAVEEHRTAVRMYPTSLTEENNLAWVLSTCPDARYRNASEATHIAAEVVAIWSEPNYLDTLAAGYAESHDWKNAVDTEFRAQTLSQSVKHSEFDRPWPEFGRYLCAYKQHKTYLDEISAPSCSQSHKSAPAALAPSQPSAAIREYLVTLQRLYSSGPTLSTPAQRETFCRQWSWLMDSFKLSASYFEANSSPLPSKAVEQIVDCNKTLERLEEFRQTPYSNPEFDWMRRHVEDRVATAVNQLGLALKRVPTVGTLPVDFLNAKVIQVPGTEDPLIVVNDEVFRLPYGMSKTVVEAVDFKIVNGHFAYVLTDADQIKKHLEDNPSIVRNFEFVILEYLHRAPKVLDQPTALNTDKGLATSLLYYGLADAIEIFIFSHEYAHLILGHTFQRNQPLALPGPGSSASNVEEKVYSWKQELEADAYGFLIMDAVLKQDAIERSHDVEADPLYPLFLSAPSFFFISMDMVEQAKAIMETGQAPPVPSKDDIAVAENAVQQMFTSEAVSSGTAVKVEQDEHSNSHPPFLIRFGEAKILAEKAQSLFFENSKVPPDLAQVYRLGALFQQTLVLLSEQADPLFHERYLASGTQDGDTLLKGAPESSKEGRVAANDLSPSSVQEELKNRGVDVFDRGRAGPVTDSFVKYHFLAGDSSNLVSESPNVRKAAENLAKSLAGSGLRSKVKARTKTDGARIHFQLIGRTEDIPSSRLTNNTEDEIPIGFYFIWSERQGRPTSSRTDIFRVVQSQLVVDIEETTHGLK